MTDNRADRLYNLMPAIYRQRDTQIGYPLRALLQVIATQVNIVEDEIAQLYENWFIETCQDWVVPYIGDLIDYRPIQEPGFVPTRSEVGNTIALRRRKGSLGALKLVASAAGGWPVLITDFRQALGVTQSANHLRLHCGRTAALRHEQALGRLSGPFDRTAHTISVRESGRYNLDGIGVFVWRLKPCSVTKTPAHAVEEVGPNVFTFSILGNNSPLFIDPLDPAIKHEEVELFFPVGISRSALENHKEDYYGEGKSFVLYTGSPIQAIPADQIVAADLSGWKYRPRRNQVAVDPELGRIAFAPDQWPRKGLWVSYYYGFGADIGGGEYTRPILDSGQPKIYHVGEGQQYARISNALDAWNAAKNTNAVIEIDDSDVYVERINVALPANTTLQLRAGNGHRPVIRLLEWNTDMPNFLSITGEPGSKFVMDGLMVTSRSIEIHGALDEVVIRHSTLVPGWGLHHNCEPRRPNEPSLELIDTTARITIEHSIIGSIRVTDNEVKNEPISIRISDSVVDSMGEEREALSSPDGLAAYVELTLLRCTVYGRIYAHVIELAQDSIFTGTVHVARRQIGCVRFCYVPPGSRTPRRFKCQPDGVDQLTVSDAPAVRASERSRVEPEFNSRRYGDAAYCQLADDCAAEIKSGANDTSEMGVLHDLFEPQRANNLQTRANEFTPAGLTAEVIFAS
jgi:hypothetical protein